MSSLDFSLFSHSFISGSKTLNAASEFAPSHCFQKAKAASTLVTIVSMVPLLGALSLTGPAFAFVFVVLGGLLRSSFRFASWCLALLDLRARGDTHNLMQGWHRIRRGRRVL